MKKSTLFLFGSALLSLALTGCNNGSTESKTSGETSFSMFSTSVNHSWDGNPSASLSGEGTVESPYILGSAADFLAFANRVNSSIVGFSTCHALLTADIDLEYYEWTPIHSFSGTIDGGNHTISRLRVSSGSGAGIFKTLKGATILDLSIEGVVDAEEQVGLLAGVVGGVSTITNVKVSGSVRANANYAGGIVGQVNNGDLSISACESKVNVIGRNSVGGIIGTNTKSKITILECTNEGTVSGNSYVGGIIGYLQLPSEEGTSSSATGCVNKGNIEGLENVGGITGCSTQPLTRCSFTKPGLVTLKKGEEKIVAKTHTSYVSPYLGNIAGRTINDGVTTFGTITECANEDGWANTMFKGGKGCSRVIGYKDKVYLFTATNNYAISEDNGHTFGPFINITNANTASEVMPNGSDVANDTGNTQPFVLPDGRIMIMYRMIRKNNDAGYNYYSLRLRFSDTEGHFDPTQKPITFIENCVGPTSGTPGGLWEPFPLQMERDEATGRTLLYTYVSSDCHQTSEYTFANGYKVKPLPSEIIAPGTSQNTIMIPITIYDGATEEGEGKVEVGAPRLIFKASELMRIKAARPGMTILGKLIDGTYVMSMENCEEQNTFVDTDGKTKGGYNMVTQISYSRDGLEWTRPQTIIRPHHPSGSTNAASKLFKCATSGVAVLPDGRLLISCASDEDYVGAWPSDSSHYDQMRAFITDKPIHYGDTFFRDEGLTQLNIYNYNENEYTVWGCCNYVNGRLYVTAQYGVNSISPDGKISSPVDGTWMVSNDFENIK
ncbi:MAG: hypothetical protein MJ239_07605 [Bacilli bacterium]|nr:hypothetical protein [Bacilli bacterium]